MIARAEAAGPAGSDPTGVAAGHEGPAMMCISTSWCTPCQLLTPLLPRLAAGLRLQLVDGDDAPETLDHYAGKVFPTLLLIRNGMEAGRVTGYDGLCQAVAG